MDGSRTALAQQPRREEQLQKLVIGAGARAHHRGVAPGNGRTEATIALPIRATARRKLPDRASDGLGEGAGPEPVPGSRQQRPCPFSINIMYECGAEFMQVVA